MRTGRSFRCRGPGFALLAGLALLAASTAPVGAQDLGAELERYRVKQSKERGLRWLVGEQDRHTGAWPQELGGPPDVGTTAVCVLALMADGNTPYSGRYADNVARGIAFVRDSCRRFRPDQLGGESTVLQSELGESIHIYLAALMLAEVVGTEADGTRKRADHERDNARRLRELTKHIEATQTPDGGWGGRGRAPIFSTTTAFLALRSARASGVAVGSGSLDKLLGFVKGMYREASGEFDSGLNAGIPLYDTCNALRILYGLGLHRSPMGERATARLLELVKTRFTVDSIGGEELLCWWFVTSTLVHEGGPDFAIWFGLVSDKLLQIQNADGSWTGHGCINGRVFCTATALLTLESPHRYLPMDSL